MELENEDLYYSFIEVFDFLYFINIFFGLLIYLRLFIWDWKMMKYIDYKDRLLIEMLCFLLLKNNFIFF